MDVDFDIVSDPISHAEPTEYTHSHQPYTQPKTRKEHEVWQACQSLLDEQHTIEQITGLAIGNRLVALGLHRGSNSDIHRYRKSWLRMQGYTDSNDDDNRKSPLMPQAYVSHDAKQLQIKFDALQQAYQDCLIEKVIFQTQLETLEKSTGTTLTSVSSLVSEIAAQNKTVLQQVQVDQQQIKSHYQQIEQRLHNKVLMLERDTQQQVLKFRQQIEKEQAEAQRLMLENSKLSQSTQQMRDSTEQLKRDNEALREQLRQAEEASAGVNEALNQRHVEVVRSSSTVQQQEQRIEKLQQSYDQLSRHRHESKALLHSLKDEVTNLMSALSAVNQVSQRGLVSSDLDL